MNEKNLDLLIYSLDHPLNAAEQATLDAALAGSEALRAEQERLLRMREALSDLSVSEDPAFSADLLQKLESGKRQKIGAAIHRIYPKVAAAAVLLFLITAISIYLTEGNLSVEAIVGTQDLLPEDAYSYLGY